MATTDVNQELDEFPVEITAAVEGMAGETERAVLTLLYNEGDKAFSELQERVGDEEKLHQQTLADALDNLKTGGLIRKRISATEEDEL